jgi:hypothetical protein
VRLSTKAVVSKNNLNGALEGARQQALEFVRNNTRTSEYRTVEVEGEAVSLKYLLVAPERQFELYHIDYPGGLGRTAFLKQIRTSEEFTNVPWYSCLCAACDKGRKAVIELVDWLCSAEIMDFLGYVAGAEEWSQHKAAVRAVKTRLFKDLLSEVKSFVARLENEAVLQNPYEELPHVDYGCLSLLYEELENHDLESSGPGGVINDRLEEYVAAVRAFERHIQRWGHQTARFEMMKAMLTTSRRLLVVDFKEKMRSGRSTAELQQDYFGGTYMSLLGIIMFYVDEDTGQVCRKNLMVTSNDTKQDTDWFVQCIDVTIGEILDGAPDGVELVWWGDNGPHFHNNILLAKLRSLLIEHPTIGSIRDEYFEAGEAKGDADQEFAKVSGECKAFIRVGGSIEEPAHLAIVLGKMMGTSPYVLEVDRDKFTSEYTSYAGMSQYSSYCITQDRPVWVARPLTFAGKEVNLHGTLVYREKRASKGEAADLLSGSLARQVGGYGGAAELFADLTNKEAGGVLTKNDAFKTATTGQLNARGEMLVSRLTTHFEKVYSAAVQQRATKGKKRTPTGMIELLIKAERIALAEAP